MDTGIGGERAPAPQARLMATVITAYSRSGCLGGCCAWRVPGDGIECLGLRRFLRRGFVHFDRDDDWRCLRADCCAGSSSAVRRKKSDAESEVSPGSLYSSGLIAAGGVIGLLSIVIKVLEDAGWMKPDTFNVGTHGSAAWRQMAGWGS